jgi:hypothetical protein
VRSRTDQAGGACRTRRRGSRTPPISGRFGPEECSKTSCFFVRSELVSQSGGFPSLACVRKQHRTSQRADAFQRTGLFVLLFVVQRFTSAGAAVADIVSSFSLPVSLEAGMPETIPVRFPGSAILLCKHNPYIHVF